MSKVSKFIAALVGAVASAVSLGLVPDSAAKWVAIAIGFLTAAGVYVVPNKTAPGGAVGGALSPNVVAVITKSGETLAEDVKQAFIKAYNHAQTTYTATDLSPTTPYIVGGVGPEIVPLAPAPPAPTRPDPGVPEASPQRVAKAAKAAKKAAKKATDAGAIGLIELGAVCGIVALIGVVCIVTGIIPIR